MSTTIGDILDKLGVELYDAAKSGTAVSLVLISNGQLEMSDAEPLATIYCLDPAKRVTITQYRVTTGQPLDPALVRVIDGRPPTGNIAEPGRPNESE